MIGQTVGSYTIIAQIGEGGMGVVYRAEHKLIGKRAAVKVLLPQFSHNKEVVDRFFNEAKATTSIHHAGIIEVFDFGYHTDGSAFIVMEFLDGETLDDRIKRYRLLAPDNALQVARQVCRALGAAHAMGVVHRDLKPENIFLVSDADVVGGERAKVLDFGIAKLSGGLSGAERTRTGVMMGTPAYMAPEQCKGAGGVDHRADLYALGCILFEMVCGRRPFVAEGAGQILGMHMYEVPPLPRSLQPSLSPGLEAVIMQLLAKEPNDRFQSAAEVIAALEALMQGQALPVRGGLATDATMAAASVPSSAAPVSMPPQTTLGGAVGVVQATAALPGHQRSGRPRYLVPVLVVSMIAIAAGVAALVMASGGADEHAGAEQATPVAAAPSGSQPGVSANTGAAAPESEVKDREPTESQPAIVDVRLEIEPATARVELDGVLTTANPLRLPQSAEKHKLKVSAPGHQTETLTITANSNELVKLVLEKKADASASLAMRKLEAKRAARRSAEKRAARKRAKARSQSSDRATKPTKPTKKKPLKGMYETSL